MNKLLVSIIATSCALFFCYVTVPVVLWCVEFLKSHPVEVLVTLLIASVVMCFVVVEECAENEKNS